MKFEKEYRIELKPRKHIIPTMPTLNYEVPWIFFYGTSQGNPTICGVGVVFFIIQSHFFHLCYVVGSGSNTMTELQALHVLLFSLNLGI